MPSSFATQAKASARIWWKTVTVGPWESGPIWFLAVLLAFDMLAAVVYRVAPGIVEAIGRLSTASRNRPALAFWTLLAASVVVYVPLDLYFGIGRWFTLGPLAIQADRILLYMLYFFVGVGIGSAGIDRGLLSEDGELARRWPAWLSATIVTFVGLIGIIYYKREFLADPNNPPQGWNAVHAFFFASFSASQTLNLLALFLKFESRGWSILDPFKGKLVWNLPDPLCPAALAAICAVRHHAGPGHAGDRHPESADRLCTDACDQLGRNGALRKIPGVAQVL